MVIQGLSMGVKIKNIMIIVSIIALIIIVSVAAVVIEQGINLSM